MGIANSISFGDEELNEGSLVLMTSLFLLQKIEPELLKVNNKKRRVKNKITESQKNQEIANDKIPEEHPNNKDENLNELVQAKEQLEIISKQMSSRPIHLTKSLRPRFSKIF